MKLYAVYTQWYPTYEYEPSLESLWTEKQLAIEAAKKITKMDYVWVSCVYANHDDINGYGLVDSEEDAEYIYSNTKENKA